MLRILHQPWLHMFALTIGLLSIATDANAPARVEAQVCWFDNPRGGILEIPPELTPTGLALELHVDISGGATEAVWLLEDGTLLSRPRIASA